MAVKLVFEDGDNTPSSVLLRQSYHGNEMKNINVNLKSAANYFIQLFYKTGCKYSCTQTKIGKLLTILAFLYARRGMILFEETIYRYKGCGAIIDNLKSIIVDRDVYINSEYDDFDGEIRDSLDSTLFNELGESLGVYSDISGLSPECVQYIEQVFRRFGAYSAYSLGQLINPIVDHKDVVEYNEIVNLDSITRLNLDDFEQSNELIEYIFS